MSTPLASPAAPLLHEPIRRFCGSHQDIFNALGAMRRLPALAEALEQARSAALATLALFERDVAGHHADEERVLFEAVMRSARGTADEARVDELVSRLTAEHRRIERLWAQLRPAVRAVAAGRAPAQPGFAGAVEELVRSCMDHACLEEESFLPLAERILARDPNHMAALGLALHLQHLPLPRPAYV